MTVYVSIMNFDQRPASRSTLEIYGGRLTPCGTKNGRIVCEGPVGIFSLENGDSRLGTLAHATSHGSLILWNGRLDNKEELARAMEERSSAFCTDGELVTAAFERWGTQCFERLVGDWSLAALERLTGKLTLAIDRMAMRRMYYIVNEREVHWCSHLEALLPPVKGHFHLDDEYVAGYLAGFAFPGRTPYREIHAVEPGQFVEIKNGVAAYHTYTQFNSRLRIRYKTDHDYEDHFRFLFRQAVRRRLRSDAPILADLSGGLDSSSIVCVADDILRKEGAETPRLDTYSHFDLGEPNGDDLHYLSIVEKNRGRTGHHLDLSRYPKKFKAQFDSFQIVPGLFGSSPELESELARIWHSGGYKVRLCGIGGDEMLGGVPDPRAQLADLLVELRWLDFFRAAITWSLIKREPWIQLAWRAAALLLPAVLQTHVVSEATVPEWIDARFIDRVRLPLLQLGPTNKYGFRLPSQQECARTIVAMARQQASSPEFTRAGEESASPFLDRDLTEFILAIPREQIIRPGQRRSLMRRSLAGLVPQEILDRKTKGTGARRPLLAMAEEWVEIEKLLRTCFTARFGFVDQERFRSAIDRARNGDAPRLVRLIRTLSLELWLSDVVGRGVIAAPADYRPVEEVLMLAPDSRHGRFYSGDVMRAVGEGPLSGPHGMRTSD